MIRLWNRTREREAVAKQWLDLLESAPAYAEMRPAVRRHWLLQGIESVLADRATAVFVAHDEGATTDVSGFLVLQQPKESGPVVYWLWATDQLFRDELASTLPVDALVTLASDCPRLVNTLRTQKPPRDILHNHFLLWVRCGVKGTSDYAARRRRRVLSEAGYKGAPK